MTDEKGLKLGLLALRIGIAVVFLAWTLDKIFNPQHNTGMINHYYFVRISHTVILIVGIAELFLLGAFLLGIKKNITYLLILLFHLVTTIASFKRLLPPYEIHQLLYFGSIPMLGACICLYLARNYDTLFTLGGSKA